MFERKEPYKEGELNIKTPEEAEAKGHEMMTPEQSKASERQRIAFEKFGAVILESIATITNNEVSEEDCQRWPGVFSVCTLSGQLKDGRRIMLKCAYTKKLDAEKSEIDFIGTINDQSLPAHVAKSLFEKYDKSAIKEQAKDYYADAEKANLEVATGTDPSLWEDLLEEDR